jgi:hypothetical protein
MGKTSLVGLVGLGLSLAALAASGACSSDTEGGQASSQTTSQATTGSGGGATLGCGELGQSFADQECTTCAETSCCDELLACDSGTPCNELVACQNACSDDACVSGCETTHADGKSTLDTLNACLDGQCAEPCATPTVGVCGTELTTNSEECDSCIGDSCCTPLQACVADSVCNGCLLVDPNAMECATDALLEGVHTCFSDSCASVCDG